ncbi:MAG: aminotransferase class IV [Myxococcales bacterium]|nr:aminotransferase class IV [Myxococcales bacterium]
MASIDGEVTPLARAAIPVTDRGLLFGDHVFEIARAQRAWLVDGDAHLARLARSAAACGLPPPAAALGAWIAATIDAAAEPAAVARVIWTAGDGTAVRRRRAQPGRAVVLVEPFTPSPSVGVRLVTRTVERCGRTGALVPAGAKTGSYLASVLALAAADAVGADDALLVDPDDRVLETATSNVAIVEGGRVTIADGPVLLGVTAARLVQLLSADGVAIARGLVTRARLDRADEVFTTSSRRGVTAVLAIDGAVKGFGPTTRRAIDRYDGWITSGRAGPPLAL